MGSTDWLQPGAPTSKSLKSYFETTISPDSLAFFRISFGAVSAHWCLSALSLKYIGNSYSPLTLHFPYPGFAWMRPLPGEGMIHLTWFLALCGLALALGLYQRPAAALLTVGFSYLFFLDKANYNNHYYLMCLFSFLFVLTPANRRWALDATFAETPLPQAIPRWAVDIFIFQLAVVYIYGGIAKFGTDWLNGLPLGIWLTRDTPDFFLLRWGLPIEWVAKVMSWAGLLLDLFAPFFLLYRPTRLFAAAGLVLFHALNARLFEIGTFPEMMILATTLFFRPDWPSFLWAKIRKCPLPALAPHPPERMSPRLTTLLVVYCVLQLLIPLRHYFYPGPSGWRNEATWFSWRMKLNSIEGSARYFVVQNGERTEIDIEPYLTRGQQCYLYQYPDMVHDFARMLRQRLEDEGRSDFAISAVVEVSLNGREKQLLVDPERDLSLIPSSLRPADWIMPLESPPLPFEKAVRPRKPDHAAVRE